jgi:hypothetical protein
MRNEPPFSIFRSQLSTYKEIMFVWWDWKRIINESTAALKWTNDSDESLD